MKAGQVIPSRAIALTAMTILGSLAPVATAAQASASGVTVISHLLILSS